MRKLDYRTVLVSAAMLASSTLPSADATKGAVLTHSANGSDSLTTGGERGSLPAHDIGGSMSTTPASQKR